ncbi:MAG TPA: SDR family NAD(P)-dependent oxidoreductase [Williamwhitmania sp.]|nr:SDR family NAD(P)-dependent oxidoreductase [Williamwhitmania sp.]
MARVFITGSSDGLGLMAAKLLVAEGHKVVLHGRNPQRAEETLRAVSGAEAAVYGDLSSIDETKELAKQVNNLGAFDAIIHNAGVGFRGPHKEVTAVGIPTIFAVNSLAPYILTCLINRPKRLVYVSSGLHRGGDISLKDLFWEARPWNGFNAYSDTKLHNLILSMAIAQRWKNVLSNAIEPGWVATKLGGAEAPDSLEEGYKTQAWLATSNDKEAMVTGGYFFHKRPKEFQHATAISELQDKLIREYERISGIPFPTY